MFAFILAEFARASSGAGIGTMIAGPFGSIVGGAAGTVLGVGINSRLSRFNERVTELTRQALTDPVFAKALMENYNPKLPSKKGQAAMDYVNNRLAGIVAPQINTQRQ